MVVGRPRLAARHPAASPTGGTAAAKRRTRSSTTDHRNSRGTTASRSRRVSVVRYGSWSAPCCSPAGIVVWRSTQSDDSEASGSSGSGKTESSENGKTIEPGQPVTAQTLGEVNPQAFYESNIKHQMTQPLERVKSSMFGDSQKFAARADTWSMTDISVDHKTNNFYYFQTILTGTADDEPTNIACVNGKEWGWSNFSKNWSQDRYQGQTCTRKPFLGCGDAVVSSGLTGEQADKVIAKLRTYKGYVNARNPRS